MTYTHFLHNDSLQVSDKAVISLNSIEYSYGFGVYETIRVVKRAPRYLDDHIQRLLESAKIINLDHKLSANTIRKGLNDLIAANKIEACNIKVLLIGGPQADAANLYALCLQPLFPDRKLYKQGVSTISYKYERLWPHAKTLNMLPSYIAYRDAKQAGAYDALLIDSLGNITEGTRTNFFACSGNTIISPPESKILLGITREKVLQVAKTAGLKIIEQDLPLSDIRQYDNVFFTSTSSKVMPIKSIDQHAWDSQSPALLKLMQAYNEFDKADALNEVSIRSK